MPVKHVPLSPSSNHKEQECSYVICSGIRSIEANETTQILKGPIANKEEFTMTQMKMKYSVIFIHRWSCLTKHFSECGLTFSLYLPPLPPGSHFPSNYCNSCDTKYYILMPNLNLFSYFLHLIPIYSKQLSLISSHQPPLLGMETKNLTFCDLIFLLSKWRRSWHFEWLWWGPSM